MVPNHWRGTLTAGQGKPMGMHWDVRVHSASRMDGESVARVNVPSACTISTPFAFVRQ